MADVALGSFDAVQRKETRSIQVGRTERETPWVSIAVGVALTLGLFALKVTSLGLKEDWGFYDDLVLLRQDLGAWGDVPWHFTQWSDIGVFALEAIVAGAAGSIVFNYAVNNISQTISNIWNQVDLSKSSDPTIMRVEPETRAWLSGLTHESAGRAADAMRVQEVRIRDLQAEIENLKAANARLDSDIEAGNARLSSAFATLIEQIRHLKEELSRRGPD